MAIADVEAQTIALEVAEAVPALRKFFALPREDKIVVAKHMVDSQIGSDDTAQIRSVAGMTPEMVEMITDPLLGVIASALINLIDGPDAP
jgi:isopenicillin N synthase-like dioxygenase